MQSNPFTTSSEARVENYSSLNRTGSDELEPGKKDSSRADGESIVNSDLAVSYHMENDSATDNQEANPLQLGQEGHATDSEIRAKTQSMWKGFLKWSGHTSQGRKDMHTFVTAKSMAPQRCHADTWPQMLTLIPTTAVSMQILQDWMKFHTAALCAFHPAIPSDHHVDVKMNETNYLVLVRVLTDLKFFATASWRTPSGVETKNALIFPVKNIGLLGAIFPFTGIPELSNVSTGNTGLSNFHPTVNPLANLPPQVIQRLEKLTPEQRNSVIKILLHQKREEQLGNQNQAMGGNSVLGSASQVPTSYNRGSVMSLHNGTNSLGSPAFNPPNTMLSGSQHDVPVTTNSSHEKLQSFMQLNLKD